MTLEAALASEWSTVVQRAADRQRSALSEKVGVKGAMDWQVEQRVTCWE